MASPYIFKVILAGPSGAGKTSLMTRFTTGQFPQEKKMTIGASFSIKDITLDSGQTCRLQLWDFGGEERFRFLLGDYCRGASGALVCFDLANSDSFRVVPEWMTIIRKNAGMIPIALVGNKSDLPNQQVEFRTAEQYAVDAQCEPGAIFCSAKLNDRVDSVFHYLAKWLIHKAGGSSAPPLLDNGSRGSHFSPAPAQSPTSLLGGKPAPLPGKGSVPPVTPQPPAPSVRPQLQGTPSAPSGLQPQLSPVEQKTRLFGMIKARKRIQLETASQFLGMPPAVIEGWIYDLVGEGKIEGDFQGSEFLITSDVGSFIQALDAQFGTWGQSPEKKL